MDLVILMLLASLHLAKAINSTDYLQYYEYDKDLPLNATMDRISENPRYVVYKVYYTSINNERVPALLIIPKKNKAPHPCIIFLHGYGGRKEDILPAADLIAEAGYAVLSIDAPLHGERSVPGKELYSPIIEESFRGFIQAVVDLRRAIDFLESIEEIDHTRIGYAGGSMGGIIGAIFIGVEPRVKAAVLAVAGGSMSLMIARSKHPSVIRIREKLPEMGISYEELQKMLDPIDPLNFIHLFSPRPLQLHLAKYDEIVPTEAQAQLAKRAREPKEIYWYNTGHNLPLDLVLARALDFFDNHLKGEKHLVSREAKLLIFKALPFIGLVVLMILLTLIMKYLIGRQ
ncbi:MAG: hypothetical protein DRN15_07445 [Thermoprotei archaeon]|nr:MAG: hypothetical protein DRN15_07445 [Thermoprotei archaeon]RLF23340.1 MAG: hypothetical protein DRM97_04915 [Thermoprotei archaeon]